MKDSSIDAFFELVRAGLWEKEACLSQFEKIEIKDIKRLSEEQSVPGLIAAGLTHVQDVKLSKKDVLFFVGNAIQLEQRNLSMNSFIEKLIERMRSVGAYSLLMKGQGIAQCYERPLWRACGDVDLLLDDENYSKAKSFLIPMASSIETEGRYTKHLGMVIDNWVVELHGSLRFGMSSKIDQIMDEIRDNVIHGGDVRTWMNERTPISLPGVNSDAICVFTHFLSHFYKGGVGIRQICDWSRLLWANRGSVDVSVLIRYLRRMGLLSEWKAFGAFAVEYLGMPEEAMPLYVDSAYWKRKAKLIRAYVMEVGNFGHNRDSSYYSKYPYVIRKAYSLGRRCLDIARHARLFPIDSLRFFPRIVINGFRSAARGE